MASTSLISCSINTTDVLASLGIEIWLDDRQILNQEHVVELIEFKHELPDDDSEHELQFVMKNKTIEHTKIDEQGNIVSDAQLTISNLAFDEIELKQIFIDRAVYTHNFNGTQTEIQDKFYSEMGCNGTVSLKFTTPIYLWLLENM
jgi:hypothetical protein